MPKNKDDKFVELLSGRTPEVDEYEDDDSMAALMREAMAEPNTKKSTDKTKTSKEIKVSRKIWTCDISDPDLEDKYSKALGDTEKIEIEEVRYLRRDNGPMPNSYIMVVSYVEANIVVVKETSLEE